MRLAFGCLKEVARLFDMALDNRRSICLRPSIGNTMRFALIFWLGAFISYSFARSFDAHLCYVLSLLFLSVALAGGIGWALRRGMLFIWAVALAAGGCLGFTDAVSLHGGAEEPPSFPTPLSLTLIEDASLRNDEHVALARCETVDGDSVILEVTFENDPGLLLYGDVVVCASSVEVVAELNEYAWSRGVVARVSVYSFELLPPQGVYGFIKALRERALEAFSCYGGKQAALLQALVCGYRPGVDASGEYAQYQVVGLAHIIAVSGSHLAIVALFVSALARLAGLPACVRVVLVVLFVAAYLVFSGCSVSAARSVLMVTIALTSLFAKRRASSQNALAICVIGFIIVDPKTAVSVSFILSAGSTLGIILFSGLISSWFPEVPRGARALLVEPLSLTFASALAMQLYAAALFSQFPLISPLANLIAAPLFSLGTIVGLVSALVACACEPLASVSVSAAALAVVPLQIACDVLSSASWACVPFEGSQMLMLAVSVGLCALLYRVWPDGRQALRGGTVVAALLLLLAAGRGVYLAHLDEIIMLDVGQGDSFVIRSGGSVVLVDTGNRPALLREALARNGVYSLDAVIITHADDDHCGSLGSLANVVDLNAIFLADGASTCPCDNCVALMNEAACLRGAPDIQFLTQGNVLRIGGFSAEVVWPEAYTDEGGNADSLCLLLEHEKGGWLMLLTGDAEAEELAQILLHGNVDDVVILKVGHHGSAHAVTPETLETLDPEIALISVGTGNWYGHPHSDTLDMLEKSGARVFRTDLHGDIRVRFGEDALEVLA